MLGEPVPVGKSAAGMKEHLEPDTEIDPSRFFNLTANGNTGVVKTSGGRAGNSVNELNAIDRAARIGMIVVLQHSGCAWSPGGIKANTEANVRSDVTTLKNSPCVRKGIPTAGYALDAETGQLKEVNIQRSTQDEAARQQVPQEFQGFAPFWS
ncbi:hypothetical protein P171DRAFT_480567 [Karstenula rhodostoma CBS 690.94]|uniref:Carbonic anhydrase n=1 Tax=Karstenula rhodostoma CBS 690.94 TaxID=1392251 RepID=A0A9P4PSP5_9PLEO|nr:hypothetical protein P171DRAFT_480567 [Karstenula rhodostoma CBS 690.94]